MNNKYISPAEFPVGFFEIPCGPRAPFQHACLQFKTNNYFLFQSKSEVPTGENIISTYLTYINILRTSGKPISREFLKQKYKFFRQNEEIMDIQCQLSNVSWRNCVCYRSVISIFTEKTYLIPYQFIIFFREIEILNFTEIKSILY